MKPPRRRDWFKTAVHFFCGVAVGAFFGFGLWAKSQRDGPTSLETGVLLIGGCAFLFGLLAAIFLDEFWEG
jgi:hypothetical protein